MNDIVTIAEADTYFLTRLGSDAWNQASSADRTKSIKMATRIIASLNLDESTTDYDTVETADFPTDMKEATYEILIKLLDGFDIDDEQNNLRIASERIAGFSAKYTDDTQLHVIAGVPSLIAWRLLQQYLADPTTIQLDRIT